MGFGNMVHETVSGRLIIEEAKKNKLRKYECTELMVKYSEMCLKVKFNSLYSG